MRVIVVGGGIAGLAAAVALGQAGHAVTVLEQAPALTDIGAGVQLSPNATRLLRRWGVDLDHAFAPRAAVLRGGASGRVLFRAALGAAAARRWGAPYLHAHRADLVAALARAAAQAGADLLLGARVEAVEADTGLVTLAGSRLTADLVLAADGIASRLAPPGPPPRFTGQVAWRALVEAPTPMPPDATVWAGPGRHLVSYYLRGGALLNLVAVEERAAWTAEGWATPGAPDALRAAFAGWHPDLVATLALVQAPILWGLHDRAPRRVWHRARLLAVGDAAHPMLPFLAQGAAMGIEDAAALARHLAAAPLPGALAAFVAERAPRTARVQARAAAMGRLYHRRTALGRLVHHGPAALVTRLAPRVAAGRLDWLYGHDAGD